ncbi:META and DUF4377 domain-containing protein [Stenotrophomonas sp. PS02289]|uniref:META and DUF4377 domain-containing protein n=1 Tax=Stenotrophomonas sp. PS02289 TaxID=2991422 RepID=UPI00249C045F|nr:META and DUF4377 domain-containing protein [Stenotrophomonas sp. PS02289]
MKRNLMLVLPLALLAACSAPSSQTPGGPARDELAPAPTAAADQKAVALLDQQRLLANHWVLENATDSSGKRLDVLLAREEKPVTLDFQDGRIAVSNTCNRMSGGYTLADGTLTVSPLASTMMACTDKALMALDQAVGSRLEGALKAELGVNDQLTLHTASGDLLVFGPRPTAETRFGGPGETVFIEVAAQTKPCPHPLIRDMQCLQTREVKFDEQGLKQGTPGAFENFYSSIEGYTHEPGTRNVLRVKRFAIANPPADAPAQAYVLDMVVESATEK